MRIILDRCSITLNWLAEIDDSDSFLVDGCVTALDAVIAVQRDYPEADVGVRSMVFGPATVARYGSVVWMQAKLAAMKEM